jgi:hypothetical protein
MIFFLGHLHRRRQPHVQSDIECYRRGRQSSRRKPKRGAIVWIESRAQIPPWVSSDLACRATLPETSVSSTNELYIHWRIVVKFYRIARASLGLDVSMRMRVVRAHEFAPPKASMRGLAASGRRRRVCDSTRRPNPDSRRGPWSGRCCGWRRCGFHRVGGAVVIPAHPRC